MFLDYSMLDPVCRPNAQNHVDSCSASSCDSSWFVHFLILRLEATFVLG